MITPPKDCNAHLASSWTAGIAGLFLAIGLSGAGTPLLPENPTEAFVIETGDLVMLEALEAPPSPATVESPPESAAAAASTVELEIPRVPEITPPLTVPEMAEIIPLEAVTERPAAPPDAKPAVVKPRPAAATRPSAPGGIPSTQTGPSTLPSGKPGGTGPLSTASGSGKGRFPQPSYPAAARRSGLQGNVRLAITVEAGGLPSSVSVVSSSGHAMLDAAARDQVQRRWRWPAGGVRQFIIPVRFVLK